MKKLLLIVIACSLIHCTDNLIVFDNFASSEIPGEMCSGSNQITNPMVGKTITLGIIYQDFTQPTTVKFKLLPPFNGNYQVNYSYTIDDSSWNPDHFDANSSSLIIPGTISATKTSKFIGCFSVIFYTISAATYGFIQFEADDGTTISGGVLSTALLFSPISIQIKPSSYGTSTPFPLGNLLSIGIGVTATDSTSFERLKTIIPSGTPLSGELCISKNPKFGNPNSGASLITALCDNGYTFTSASSPPDMDCYSFPFTSQIGQEIKLKDVSFQNRKLEGSISFNFLKFSVANILDAYILPLTHSQLSYHQLLSATISPSSILVQSYNTTFTISYSLSNPIAFASNIRAVEITLPANYEFNTSTTLINNVQAQSCSAVSILNNCTITSFNKMFTNNQTGSLQIYVNAPPYSKTTDSISIRFLAYTLGEWNYFTDAKTIPITEQAISLSSATISPASITVGSKTLMTLNLVTPIKINSGTSYISITSNNPIDYSSANSELANFTLTTSTNLILKYTGSTGTVTLSSIPFYVLPLKYISSSLTFSINVYEGDGAGTSLGSIASTTLSINTINPATITSATLTRSGNTGDASDNTIYLYYDKDIFASDFSSVTVKVSFIKGMIENAAVFNDAAHDGYVFASNTSTPTQTGVNDSLPLNLIGEKNSKDNRASYGNVYYTISRSDTDIIAQGSIAITASSISAHNLPCTLSANDTTIKTGANYALTIICTPFNIIEGYFRATLQSYNKLAFASAAITLNSTSNTISSSNYARIAISNGTTYTVLFAVKSYIYTSEAQPIVLSTYVNDDYGYMSDSSTVTLTSASPSLVTISSITYTSMNLSTSNTVDIFFTITNALTSSDSLRIDLPTLTFSNTTSPCPSVVINMSCSSALAVTCPPNANANFVSLSVSLASCTPSSYKDFKATVTATNGVNSVSSTTANNCFVVGSALTSNSASKKDESVCTPSGLTLNAAKFTSISITQPPSIYTGSKISLSFIMTASLAISSSGSFQFEIPINLLHVLNNAVYNITCSIDNVAKNCAVISNTTTSDIYNLTRFSLNKISIQLNETASISSRISITINDLYTAYVPFSASVIGVYSELSGNRINGDTITINPIVPYSMTSTLTRSVATTDSSIDVSLTFTTPFYFPTISTFSLYLHTKQFMLAGALECPISSTCSNSVSGDFNVITMVMGTNTYAANYNMNLVIKGFSNPHAEVDMTGFDESAKLECIFNTGIYASSRNISVTPSVLATTPNNIEILLSEKTVTKQTNVTLKINNTNSFKATDVLYIGFQDPFPSISACTVLPSGVEVATDSAYKIKFKIAPNICNTTCSIVLCMQNIYSIKNMGSFKYQALDNNSTISTATCASSSTKSNPCNGFIASELLAVSLTSPIIKRAVQGASTATSLDLSFTTNFIIYSGAKATLTIPHGQIINSTAITTTSASTITDSGAIFNIEIDMGIQYTTTDNNRSFVYSYSGFMNKDKYYMDQDTATLVITESSNIIAKMYDKLYITPPIKINQFLISTSARSSNLTGRSITLSFSTIMYVITTQDYFFMIDFGDQTILKGNSEIQCSATCGATTATCETAFTTFYSSNAIMRITFNFNPNSANLTCSFSITGLKNPIYAGALASSIYYHFAYKTGYQEAVEQYILFYNGNTTALINSFAVDKCPFASLTANRGSTSLLAPSTLTINATLCNSMLSTYKFYVKVPNNLFTISTTTPCTSCTCASVVDGTKAMICSFTISADIAEGSSYQLVINGNNPNSLGGQEDFTSFITVQSAITEEKIIDEKTGMLFIQSNHQIYHRFPFPSKMIAPKQSTLPAHSQSIQ